MRSDFFIQNCFVTTSRLKVFKFKGSDFKFIDLGNLTLGGNISHRDKLSSVIPLWNMYPRNSVGTFFSLIESFPHAFNNKESFEIELKLCADSEWVGDCMGDWEGG